MEGGVEMADGFEKIVEEALAFFTQLEANNSKDWFNPRKEHYKEAIAGPAGFFADLMAEDIARLTGKPHSSKVFRIYRDVRFSKDKTPLNTHLHMMWQPADKDPLAPVWFWGLSREYFVLGMGVVGLKGEALARYRAFVDSWGDGLQSALDDARDTLGAELGDWGPEPLKNVPKPYNKDHPHAELLKRKGLTVSSPIPRDWRKTGVMKATLTNAKGLIPVWEMFDAHL
ncbi:TIGR02453 family protein [Tateyamaria sp. Alg231-49]|uniref:TIGR02453 family protein n=1 Tax=Tateyamaria sp. Alg231-49 TaxID=1922219 RepID=UPI000D557C7A|nr:TIGR02453 family protein [Tateyamaria sp. Alg231-49]